MNENDNGGKWTFVARTGAAAGGAGASWRSSEPMTRTGLGRTASSSGEGVGWGERSGGGGRPMPAAFGGAERDKRNERLEEQRRRAAEDAERQRREERERDKAERDRARRMDITNEEEFPALGGGGGARPASKKSKPALDFRAAGERGAVLGAIQEAEAATAAREHEFAAFVARMEAEERAAHRRRLAHITTHCYDDGFNEFEPPDEDEGYGNGLNPPEENEMPAYEDDDEDAASRRAEGEFNSHLAVVRRRGDKSDW